ncbi:hypothetical protein [Aquibacillus sediminis]|uniref:hypothetical protein n=1 Tax=Aquibacillus sediminis TaxID=2574734 RepID=UPI001108A2CB|nr:hypothetical protein [Aquibacillus sediminis]
MKKIVSIIVGVIVLIFALVNIPNMIVHSKANSFEKNKEVATETKTVNEDELNDILYQQMKLAEELRSSNKYPLIAEKVQKGYDEASDNASTFLF